MPACFESCEELSLGRQCVNLIFGDILDVKRHGSVTYLVCNVTVLTCLVTTQHQDDVSERTFFSAHGRAKCSSTGAQSTAEVQPSVLDRGHL